MKTLFALLIAAVTLASAQQTEKTVVPNVSLATVDSVSYDSASTTLTLPSADASIDSGQVVYGPKIQYGTIVTAVNATSDTLTISLATTDAGTEQTLNFGYFSSTAYESGDWLGLPFLIWTNSTGGTVSLESIVIADSSDQLGNTDLALFSSYADDQGLDNAAIAVPATQYKNVIGYVSLSTAIDLGSVKILTKDAQGIAIPQGGSLYGRLVAKSTPTFTGVNCIFVRLRFQ